MAAAHGFCTLAHGAFSDKACALVGGDLLPASISRVSCTFPLPSLALYTHTHTDLLQSLLMGAPPHLPVFKPCRSEVDQALHPHECLQIAEQVRLKFEMEAPRRHPKPSRSDPNSSSSAVEVVEGNVSAAPIPELLKLQALIEAPMNQPFLTEFQNFDAEEFVETDYYKDLNAVDKSLHHTTGSGFIQVDPTSFPDDTSVVFGLKLNGPPRTFVRSKSHCNPATNDWIPSPDYTPHVGTQMIHLLIDGNQSGQSHQTSRL